MLSRPNVSCFAAIRTRLKRFSTLRMATSRADKNSHQFDDAFRYSSGRWLYNESKRLEERHLPFNISELVRAAAASIGRSNADVESIQKLAEGGFNRTFTLTMKDGFQLIARLPYPLTQPKRLAVASEVATMDLIRSYGVPVPKIYGYSADAANPVGAEYILMEYVRGRLLGDVWFDLSDKERIKVLSGIVDNEAKLFEIDFPAYGSLFYEKDLPDSMGRTLLQSENLAERFCVGPDASLKFWFEERSALSIQRGPSMSAADVLERVVAKEIAWIQAYGKPRFPFDRVYREMFNHQKSSPQEHLNDLDLYVQVAPQLVPKDEWLHRPIIRHPDLNPNNIFVSEDYEIVSIIDWQHSNILPLFLHAGIPAHLQNYGDADSENLVKPQPPTGLDELGIKERAKELELYRRRHLHFYYIGATANKLSLHFDAMMHEGGLFRSKIFQHAGAPWEGNNIPLKADLVILSEQWQDIVPDRSEPGSLTQCPFSFEDQEVRETLECITRQEEADQSMRLIRNAIGISSDGWVSTERYGTAVALATYIKEEAIEGADDDLEREMTVRHWPFDDHDETE